MKSARHLLILGIPRKVIFRTLQWHRTLLQRLLDVADGPVVRYPTIVLLSGLRGCMSHGLRDRGEVRGVHVDKHLAISISEGLQIERELIAFRILVNGILQAFFDSAERIGRVEPYLPVMKSWY